MVKVVERKKSKDEIDLEKKVDVLMALSKDIVGEREHIWLFGGTFHIGRDFELAVSARSDTITVKNQTYFDKAVNLANTYEGYTGTEWKVEKDYDG